LERTFELETPHTITDWIVNTMCVSVVDGLGIAPPTSIRVFKPYFMDFTLPYSVKRGEILPLKVSLFNYLNHALPVSFFKHIFYHGFFRFIIYCNLKFLRTFMQIYHENLFLGKNTPLPLLPTN
jgi:hypothetical protein